MLGLDRHAWTRCHYKGAFKLLLSYLLFYHYFYTLITMHSLSVGGGIRFMLYDYNDGWIGWICFEIWLLLLDLEIVVLSGRKFWSNYRGFLLSIFQNFVSFLKYVQFIKKFPLIFKNFLNSTYLNFWNLLHIELLLCAF